METIKKQFLGQRDFWSEAEILQIIRASSTYDPDVEDLDETDTILIFETSKQRTWLVATETRLYCVLDDNRRPEPSLQWTLGRETLVDEERVTVSIETHEKSARTGLLDIGPRKKWLFSKSLHSPDKLKDRLSRMIEDKMTG